MNRLFNFAVFIILNCTFCSAEKTSSLATGKVIKVEDGDTLIIYTNSHKEHVRLIGIDTPEAYENDKALRDARKRQNHLYHP